MGDKKSNAKEVPLYEVEAATIIEAAQSRQSAEIALQKASMYASVLDAETEAIKSKQWSAGELRRAVSVEYGLLLGIDCSIGQIATMCAEKSYMKSSAAALSLLATAFKNVAAQAKKEVENV